MELYLSVSSSSAGALIGDPVNWNQQMNESNQMLVFEEMGNRSTRRQTPRNRVENQQTQPTFDAESGNRTRATLVGGECSHHCAIPATRISRCLTLSKIRGTRARTLEIPNQRLKIVIKNIIIRLVFLANITCSVIGWEQLSARVKLFSRNAHGPIMDYASKFCLL